MLTQDVIEKLIQIREQCQELIPTFPHGCCSMVARLVEAQLGFRFQQGLYLADDKENIGYPHSWNILPDTGDIIDLTLEQFGSGHQHIEISDGSQDISTTRYLPDVSYST